MKIKSIEDFTLEECEEYLRFYPDGQDRAAVEDRLKELKVSINQKLLMPNVLIKDNLRMIMKNVLSRIHLRKNHWKTLL